MKQDARYLAVKILNRFEQKNEQLSQVRQLVFSQTKPEILSRSRAMVLTNEIIRLKDRLDLLIEEISGRKMERLNPTLKSILRVGFYEILYDENIPEYAAVDSSVNLTKALLNRKASGLTNAVLRNLIRTKEKSSDWSVPFQKKLKWHSLPKWIQNRWKKQFGENGFIKLAKRMSQSPKTFIRVDLSQNSLDEINHKLNKLDIESTPISSPFLKINSGAGKILFTELFRSGQISIQDPAAGAIVEFLDPKQGETVIDVCAAPGTKSLFLAEKVGESGKVLAYDLIPSRVERGKKDFERHGKKNIHWEVKDATKDDFPLSDKILIDAPCTGTGVLSRKPDIRWRRKPEHILEMAKLQFHILNHMSDFLNPGGTLVYGTCSLEPEENWMVMEQFLKLKPEFQLVIETSSLPDEWMNDNGCLQTFPHIHGVDGMFAVKITRK